MILPQAAGRAAPLLGRRVRMLWPESLKPGAPMVRTDASGVITHVSWPEDDSRSPGLDVRWDADWSDARGCLVPRQSPRTTGVHEIRWLAAEDGEPLEVPARVERVAVAGALL